MGRAPLNDVAPDTYIFVYVNYMSLRCQSGQVFT